MLLGFQAAELSLADSIEPLFYRRLKKIAGMAELADAADSQSFTLDPMLWKPSLAGIRDGSASEG